MKKYPAVKNLKEREHRKIVAEIFSTISSRYDLLNHVFSFGLDYGWRKKAVQTMQFSKSYRLLDLATGSGDLIIRAKNRFADIDAIGVDIVHPMLKLAQEKTKNTGLCQADALTLPFKQGAFDVTAIAFGMRNITNHLAVLKEMKRVTAPEGMVLILEMSLPQNRYIKPFLKGYLQVMPRAAKFFSPNPAAYGYLADSIEHFPEPPLFTQIIQKSGLTQIEHQQLYPGICHLYTAGVVSHRCFI